MSVGPCRWSSGESKVFEGRCGGGRLMYYGRHFKGSPDFSLTSLCMDGCHEMSYLCLLPHFPVFKFSGTDLLL